MQKTNEKALELREQLENELGEIELAVMTEGFTLAQAIREGSTVTNQACGWGDGSEEACAMHAAVISARARNLM